jgi:hypothetical protein
MALLIGWVAANWRIPGMVIMAAGLLMNVAAIVANGGRMPVSPDQARYAGTIDRYATDGLAVSDNSVATVEGVRLWLLTDILALPAGFPFANVYSIGDVLLTAAVSSTARRRSSSTWQCLESLPRSTSRGHCHSVHRVVCSPSQPSLVSHTC